MIQHKTIHPSLYTCTPSTLTQTHAHSLTLSCTHSYALPLSLTPTHSLSQDDDWHQCKASIPNARGFTCGMWLLFHALSTRVPEGVGGALWLAGVFCWWYGVQQRRVIRV